MAPARSGSSTTLGLADSDAVAKGTTLEDATTKWKEGISEAGAMSSFTAAGTTYASFGEQTVPFYIFYSMFGFQRVGDAIWCAADSRAKGFLLGATAGRTTLNGEGLQHQDGHSLLVATTVPCCLTYDPAFAYEIAVIVREGLRRMIDEDEDLLYYLTLYNENYPMPPKPSRAERGIIQGIYRFRKPKKPQLRLFGSGSIMQQVLRAADILQKQFGVAAEIWSVTSYGEMRRDALKCERWNWLHPGEKEKTPYIQQQLGKRGLPTVAATDFMRAVPDMVGKWVPGPYITLGTDGFGRSDTGLGLLHACRERRRRAACPRRPLVAGGCGPARSPTRSRLRSRAGSAAAPAA